jgi:hypothetical protein
MTPESILAKTAKGHEEIETRAHHLSGRLRQVLIRVDGLKSLDEFLSEAGDLAETQLAQLEDLERNGFVVDTNPGEVVVEAPVTAPMPAPMAAPPAPVAAVPPASAPPRPAPVASPMPAPASLAAGEFDSPVKFKLKDLLVDAIGIDTGRMGQALQQCRNREDLQKWVDICLPYIQQIAGKAKTATFRKAAKMLVGG